MISVRSEWRPNERVLGGSRFGWTLVGALSVALGAAAALAWVLSSFYGVDVPASVSFAGHDDYCDVATSGVGTHCFSDYSAIDFASLHAQPSGAETVYPASSRLLRLPFFTIERVFGFQAGLIAFLAVSALVLVAPALWAVRHVPWFAKGSVFTVAGLATAPALIAWDRGNVIALTVPFVFAILWGLVKQRPWIVATAIIACATIRPQFALLALALVAIREWKAALASAAGSVTTVLGSYMFFGTTWLREIRNWIADAQAWSASRSLADTWPPNISIPRVLYYLVHLSPWRNAWTVQHLSEGVYAKAAIVLVGVAMAVIVAAGKRLPPFAVGAALLVAVALALPIVFAYYAVLALPIVAIAFRYGLEGWPASGWFDKGLIAVFGASLILSLTPLLIPAGGVFEVRPGVVVVPTLIPLLATAAWMTFLAALACSGVAKMLASRTASRERNPETVHA